MPLNSSATVYGGAGGRGAKASVSTPEGLRNMMQRNIMDTAPESRSSAPVTQTEPRTASPARADPLEDNKSTLRGLNDRLSSYLDKVGELNKENDELRDKIDAIKKKDPEGRDWDKIQKHLGDLEKRIKELTLDNAKQLLLIDDTRLANEDFKNKLNDESKARTELEKDLDKVKNLISDIKLEKENLNVEKQLVKDELNHLKKEHKNEVDDLLRQIRDSEVEVEVDSSKSNLAEIICNIRVQYQKMSEKNLKETEDWYKDKFEEVKEEEAQNTEALDEVSKEVKGLEKEVKTLEVMIRSQCTTISTLEDRLNKTKMESNHRLAPLYRTITKLEANLREVRSQVENQIEVNNELLTVKMKLENEIKTYRELLGALTADNESSRFDLEDGLQSAQPNAKEVVVCAGDRSKKASARDGNRRQKK